MAARRHAFCQRRHLPFRTAHALLNRGFWCAVLT